MQRRVANTLTFFRPVAGAGEGNRTLVVSLEGFCSTIELHPHLAIMRADAIGPLIREKASRTTTHPRYLKARLIIKPLGASTSRVPTPQSPAIYGHPDLVEGEGFEPSKAEPSDLQSDPFDRSGTPPNETANCECFRSISQRAFQGFSLARRESPR